MDTTARGTTGTMRRVPRPAVPPPGAARHLVAARAGRLRPGTGGPRPAPASRRTRGAWAAAVRRAPSQGGLRPTRRAHSQPSACLPAASARPPPARPASPPPPVEQPSAGPHPGRLARTPRPRGPGVWRFGYHTAPGRAGRARSPTAPSLVGRRHHPARPAAPLVALAQRLPPVPCSCPCKLFTPGEWWDPAPPEAPRTMAGLRGPRRRTRPVLFGLLAYGWAGSATAPSSSAATVVERAGQPVLALAAAVAAMASPSAWSGRRPCRSSRPVLVSGRRRRGRLRSTRRQTVVNVIYALIAAARPVALRPARPLAPTAHRPPERPARRGTGGRHPGRPPPRPPPTSGPNCAPRAAPTRRTCSPPRCRTGRMNDVDCARVRHAWTRATRGPTASPPSRRPCCAQGGAACASPLRRPRPARAAPPATTCSPARSASAAARTTRATPTPAAAPASPWTPTLLGTSLLAVGPSGSGQDRAALVRPVVESLAPAGARRPGAPSSPSAPPARPLGPDDAFDVVVRVGDPASVHDLDLYGGTADPDEAAAVLAEGLVGDRRHGCDSRRAATALAQLLGPYRAAHGRFPAVPRAARTPRRRARPRSPPCASALRGRRTRRPCCRELDARTRQAGGPGDPGPALADRVALLDRPAFAGFFGTGTDARPFSLRAARPAPAAGPYRPARARPRRGRPGSSPGSCSPSSPRSPPARTDRSLFACLVLDDATARRHRRDRTRHPAAALGRTRAPSSPCAPSTTSPRRCTAPLLGAVGCRMAFSGVTTWDGSRFAEAWGKEWVETRDVAQHTVFADQPFTRALHALRKLVTGKAVTTDAVTVRQVERERWSASELAHAVPAGHAVLSLTTVRGRARAAAAGGSAAAEQRRSRDRAATRERLREPCRPGRIGGSRSYGTANHTDPITDADRPAAPRRHASPTRRSRSHAPHARLARPALRAQAHRAGGRGPARHARCAGPTPASSPTPCRTWRAASCC